MNDTTRDIIAKLDQLTQEDREVALSAILDRFCVRCGAAGDFRETFCGCPDHVEHTSSPVATGPKWPSFAFKDAKVDWSSAKRHY